MTSIRRATAADMAAVADLWHEGWHAGHAGHVPSGLTAARTLEAFHQRTPIRVADTTVAYSDAGELLGFVMVVGDEVEQVFVAPAARGTGLAVELLSNAEDQVAAGGYGTAWLAVVAGNARARRFYDKCGWVDEGNLPYEVVADGETFVSPCRRYVTSVSPGPGNWAWHEVKNYGNGVRRFDPYPEQQALVEQQHYLVSDATTELKLTSPTATALKTN